jgi:hypothetical protein
MPLYSVHTFMLPMRWDYLPEGFDPERKGKGNLPFDERTELQKFVDLLTSGDKAKTWLRKFYKISGDVNRYNELVYYHAHVTNNLFDLETEGEATEDTTSDHKTVLYFEFAGINRNTDSYIISVLKGSDDKPKTYTLILSGISLHVLTTGVAILTYTLHNHKYEDPADILYINEFGRRIHPPFIHKEKGLTETKEGVLADSIQLQIAALIDHSPIEETFSRYTDFAGNKIETHTHEDGRYHFHTVIDFPATVKKLFPKDNFAFAAAEEAGGNKISFRLLISDRMFFQCWYGNNTVANRLKKEINLNNGNKGFMYAESPFWYAFMYGDKKESSPGIGNKYLMQEHLLENTYTRWAGYGTVYGFTRDSFVCISSDLETLTAKKVPDISLHMQTMYYQMAVLCLAQRASVLRFSGEVAALTDLGRSWTKEVNGRIQNLNLNYIEFINKIYYREISPEIQGIEIYNHFQKAMNIEADVNDLKTELGELHSFAMMKKQDEQTHKANALNRIAAIFLPATLFFSMLGGSFLPAEMKFGGSWNANALLWLTLLAVLSWLTGWLILWLNNRKK